MSDVGVLKMDEPLLAKNTVLMKRGPSGERNEQAAGQKQKGLDDDTVTKVGKRWTKEQDDALRAAVEDFGQRNWKSIATRVPGRNHAQCLQRWNKVLKPGLVKGHWSFEEDGILERMVLQGCHSWGEVAGQIPGRTPKQCRERWRNHLDPGINKGPFTQEEDKKLTDAYNSLGNRWTQIAELLDGRTEDAVKIRWKVLNPNPKTKAKPGRPRLMPGMPSSKPKSAAPPNPVEVAAAARAKMESEVPGTTLEQQYSNVHEVPEDVKNVMHEQSLQQQRMHLQHLQLQESDPQTHQDNMMMQSYSSRVSCLSLGSINSLASFGDIPLEDLLQSGSDLDSMLKSGQFQSFGKTSALLDTFGSEMNAEQSAEVKNQFLADLAAANAIGAPVPYTNAPIGAAGGSMPRQPEFTAGQYQEPAELKHTKQEEYTVRYNGDFSGIADHVSNATEGHDVGGDGLLRSFTGFRTQSSNSGHGEQAEFQRFLNQVAHDDQADTDQIKSADLEELVLGLKSLTGDLDRVKK